MKNGTDITRSSQRLAVRTSLRAGLTYSGESGALRSLGPLSLGDTATHEVGHVRPRG